MEYSFQSAEASSYHDDSTTLNPTRIIMPASNTQSVSIFQRGPVPLNQDETMVIDNFLLSSGLLHSKRLLHVHRLERRDNHSQRT
jgi:hypothetical protein